MKITITKNKRDPLMRIEDIPSERFFHIEGDQLHLKLPKGIITFMDEGPVYWETYRSDKCATIVDHTEVEIRFPFWGLDFCCG